MGNRGYTLIEVMLAMFIMTTVSLALYYVNMAMTRATLHQESMTTLRDEGRTSLQYISRMLRIASEGTIKGVTEGGVKSILGTTAMQGIEFQAVTDLDGNGVAVAEDYTVELTDPILFQVDIGDANGDGLDTEQLVQLDENDDVVRVLSNHCASIAFVNTSGGVQISLVLTRAGVGLSPTANVRMDQVVAARN